MSTISSRGVIAGFDAPPGAYNLADDLPAPPERRDRLRRARCSGCDAAAVRPARRRCRPMARAFYAENRRVANGKAKRVLGWRPRYRRLPVGPARPQRDDQPDRRQRRARHRQPRPAIALEQRRQQHRDHRHDHARIGRLGRADRRGSRRNRAGRRAPRRTRRDRAMPSDIAERGSNTGGPVVAQANAASIAAPISIATAEHRRHRIALARSRVACMTLAIEARQHAAAASSRCPISACARPVRIDPRLVHEQQRDPRHRDRRSDQQLPPEPLPEEDPRRAPHWAPAAARTPPRPAPR